MTVGAIMEQGEVEAAIEKGFPGDVIYDSYGPNQLAQSVVWEIWVKENGREFATRFLEEFEDGTYRTYGSFQTLAVKLNKQHVATLEQIKADEWVRQKELAEVQSKNTLQSAEISNRMIEMQAKNAAQAAEISNRRIEHLVKLGIGAFCMISALGIAAYLVTTGANIIAVGAAGIVFSILASGCIWLFGKFEAFKMPTPFFSDEAPRERSQQQPGTSI